MSTDSTETTSTRLLTPYDILGYVAPGSTFLLVAVVFDLLLKRTAIGASATTPKLVTPFYDICVNCKILVLLKENWVASTATIGVVLGIAYIAGNVISSISSLALDRILFHRGYGYPYAQLLGIERDLCRNSRSGHYYRGLFFWVNAYFLLRLVARKSLVEPWSLARIVMYGIELILFAAVVSHFWHFSQKSKTEKLSTETVRRRDRYFSAGYDLLASPVSRYLGSRNTFPQPFLEQYRKAFLKIFGTKHEDALTNNFWLPYCYVLRSSATFAAALTSWLRQYTFARNLSTAFYLAFLYTGSSLYVHKTGLVRLGIPPFAPTLGANYVLSLTPILCLTFAMLLLVRYQYFYVCYFTKFLYRSFVIVALEKGIFEEAPTTVGASPEKVTPSKT